MNFQNPKTIQFKYMVNEHQLVIVVAIYQIYTQSNRHVYT